ncbi:MAG: hypothetical protein QG574_2732 [Cyanobacteriota bacterium erpe_2018_sw_21hr_WHONDRS-SW48-000092_B_bin.40]|jgi:hypothetical protein|nr:hypothetical protein [Cyanobacteriota bacterium erpe_2018_sw_21hr_WHONDRS-SW48-000092_B_bin.40]
MAATTEAVSASSPSAAWQNFPAVLPEDFDYTDFDVHGYMQTSGFNAAVDQAFAPLFTEIEEQAQLVRARLEALWLSSS